MATFSIPQAVELALQFHRDGLLANAEAIYRQILAVAPQNADALRLLGLIAYEGGAHESAVDLISRAIAQNSGVAAFHNDLGNALQCLGRLDHAVEAYQHALQLDPQWAGTHNNLGNTLKQQGRLEEAVTEYRAALALQPDAAVVHNNLGNTLMDLGQLHEAVAAYRSAVRFRPDFAIAYNHLGNALMSLQQVAAAIPEYQRAIEIEPTFALACNNLANALYQQGLFEEAVTLYKRAITLEPGLALAHNNLGIAFWGHGQVEEAVACYRRALECSSEPSICSNYLVALHYSPNVPISEIFQAHLDYDLRHAVPLRTLEPPLRNSNEPGRPLRLGFVSPHFAFHAVGHFIIRLLEHFDASAFHIIGYSDTANADGMTERIRAATTVWRETAALSDEQLTAQIRADAIDILIDLAGHTRGHRLLVFARKPAPVQITWLDYVGTTGLSAIDYLIADRHEVPREAEPFYRESVLRMPDDYICYDPPSYAPQVAPLPALAHGSITFGSFNILAKITPQMIAVWSRILHRVPQSRMLLKGRHMDEPETGARLKSLFASSGIGPDRIELLGYSPPADTISRYREIDIALDTFPYNGGLTTCEALWMGVPVVTCPGETFASRHGLTHLSAVGLTETIASSLDDYVDRAVSLALDIPQLATLREGLRDRMAASSLCDGKKFAAGFEKLLHEVWQEGTVDVKMPIIA